MLCYSNDNLVRIKNCELATTKLNFQMQYGNDNLNNICLIVMHLNFFQIIKFLKAKLHNNKINRNILWRN